MKSILPHSPVLIPSFPRLSYIFLLSSRSFLIIVVPKFFCVCIYVFLILYLTERKAIIAPNCRNRVRINVTIHRPLAQAKMQLLFGTRGEHDFRLQ